VDYENLAQGPSCEESLLHVQETAKELGSQQMALLPAHRMGSTPPFWSTAVDLFGPLSIVGTVNRRTTRKVWGLIFVCTATSLTHVEIAELYSTEAFLLALRRFMGPPSGFSRIKVHNWSQPPDR
jgi:hypothetical protein